MSEGRCSVELMNAAGYDFATLGNHDFDAGQAAVATMLDLARFRVFARNLRLDKPRAPFPDTRAFTAHDIGWHVMQLESGPPAIVTVGGVRIAFDGLMPEDTAKIMAPGLFDGLMVRGEVESARRIRDSLDRPYPAGGRARAREPRRQGPQRRDRARRAGHRRHHRRAQPPRRPRERRHGSEHRDPHRPGGAEHDRPRHRDAPRSTRSPGKSSRRRRASAGSSRSPGFACHGIAPIIERYERAVADVMDVQVATSEKPLRERARPRAPLAPRQLDDAGDARHVGRRGRGSQRDRHAGFDPGGRRSACGTSSRSPRSATSSRSCRSRRVDLKALCEKSRGQHIARVLLPRASRSSGRRSGDEKPKIVKLLRNGRALGDDEVLQVVTTDYLASGAEQLRAVRATRSGAGTWASRCSTPPWRPRARRRRSTPPADNPWVRDEAE